MHLTHFHLTLCLLPLISGIPFSSNRPRVSYSCAEECVQHFQQKTSHTVNISLPKTTVSEHVCWHFVNLRHCLIHCGKYQYVDAIWMSSMNASCAQHLQKVGTSVQCMQSYHLEIEGHCLQYIDSAVSATALQNSTPSTMCRYLRDHSRCLVANMEFYCGLDAVKLFSHENLLHFFQSFIYDRTGRTLDSNTVNQCYRIPVQPPFLPLGVVDLVKLATGESHNTESKSSWLSFVSLSLVSLLAIVFFIVLILRFIVGHVLISVL